VLRGVGLADEGVMLGAAQRIAVGRLPYGDFVLHSAPGQPVLLADLAQLVGPSLLWWRIVRVLLAATIALEVYVLTRWQASLGWALLAWAATAGAMAWPTGAGPTPMALALGLGAVLSARRAPAAAGALAGLACAFRPELGVAAALGAAIPAGAAGQAGAKTPRLSPRAGLLATAAGVAALAWAPFLLLAPTAAVDQVGGFVGGRPRPFPLRFHGPLELTSVLGFYLPLVLLAGLALWSLAATTGRPYPEELALAPLALAGAVGLVARPDSVHLIPLAAVLPAMVALAASRMPLPALRIGLAAILGLVVVQGLERRTDAAFSPPTQVRLAVRAADGVRTKPAQARALERLRVRVDARVAPGAPIAVVGPPGAALVGILLDRPPAEPALTLSRTPASGYRPVARVAGSVVLARVAPLRRGGRVLSSRRARRPNHSP
jgi:hypothetical protein